MEHHRLWVGVFTAIIGLAIVAVVLSSKASTVGVIGAASSGLGNLIAVAVSPITGNGGPPLINGGITGNAIPTPQSMGLPQVSIPAIGIGIQN